jgi:RimJ/RimL family protein N-acetyltransferase
MKYRNAAELLPPQLLQELQHFAQGELLYVPKIKRDSWGEGTGAKAFYSKRDRAVKKEFSHGTDLKKLSEDYFVSEDAVKKIVYKKGDVHMKTLDYSKYFWQNELVRVRRAKPEDWKHNYHNIINSEERIFVDYEQELPWDEETRRINSENYINANKDSEEHIIFTFENLSGEYVGGGNLHGINERNGTFGMFIYADEERYAIAAARLLLEYAFNERRLNNCHTGFIENDMVFQPVFKKLGFQLEGKRRQQVFLKGKYWDENLYGLLASEFNSL